MSAAAGGGGMVNGGMANGEAKSEEVRHILENGQLYYAATHGKYLIKNKTGEFKTNAELTAVVPPNTLLFIAAGPGEVCLFPLHNKVWPLLQPNMRKHLQQVLYEGGDENAAAVLNQFDVYVPGDKYIDRVLTIGSNDGKVEKVVGFYNFGTYDPGKSYENKPYAEWSHSDPPIVLHNLREYLQTPTNKITLRELVSALPDGQPRIIFILSCGIVRDEKVRGTLIGKEGGAGYRNKLELFSGLVHAVPHYKEGNLNSDPANSGTVNPKRYKLGNVREQPGSMSEDLLDESGQPYRYLYKSEAQLPSPDNSAQLPSPDNSAQLPGKRPRSQEGSGRGRRRRRTQKVKRGSNRRTRQQRRRQ